MAWCAMALCSVALPCAESMERAATHSREGDDVDIDVDRAAFERLAMGLKRGQSDRPCESSCDKYDENFPGTLGIMV